MKVFLTVPSATILIASKQIFCECRYLVMTNISKIAISRNYSHYGITREVRDLTSL